MAASRPDTVEEEIENLRGSLPRREPMTLVQNGGSVQQTIMEHAIEQSPVEPGEIVDQWWLPDQNYVVIDLGGGYDEC
jgi:hypothetical protein